MIQFTLTVSSQFTHTVPPLSDFFTLSSKSFLQRSRDYKFTSLGGGIVDMGDITIWFFLTKLLKLYTNLLDL